MKELMTNPYLIFILGSAVGAIAGYAFKSMMSADDPEVCNKDFSAAKSKIISISRAEEIYRSYTNRRVPIIKQFESEDFEPTRFGEIDFGTLKNYIDYLTCIEQGLNKSIKSIRIYFANYPQQFANGDPMLFTTSGGTIYPYSGRNTFFMLPTIEDGGQENGFSITDNGSGIEYRTISNFRSSRSNSEQEDESHSLVFNEVGLTPPPPRAQDDFNV